MLRSAPPPAWVDLHQELVEEMERAQRKTEDLKKLHRQHLLPGFDEDDRYTEQQQIDQLAREIAQSLQSCDLGVKQISAPGGGQRKRKGVATAAAEAQAATAKRAMLALAAERRLSGGGASGSSATGVQEQAVSQ